MGLSSLTWPLDPARAMDSADQAVIHALRRCRLSGPTSVLFVEPRPPQWNAMRQARAEGAHVTALCADEFAREALDRGAEYVIDADRTDPTWYRGAWSVIVDLEGRFGFSRALPALTNGGTYFTSSPSPRDRIRSAVSRLGGGPRLARLSR